MEKNLSKQPVLFPKRLSIVAFSIILILLGFIFIKENPKDPLQGTLTVVDNVQELNGESVLVKRVIDGDTFVTQDGQTVRLVGMDTPETVDPHRPQGCFGKEASNESRALLTNKEVILVKDVSSTDKYDRLLRYVFLPLDNNRTLFVNDYLVRSGYATVLTVPPDMRFKDELLKSEQEAREEGSGLWSACPGK